MSARPRVDAPKRRFEHVLAVGVAQMNADKPTRANQSVREAVGSWPLWWRKGVKKTHAAHTNQTIRDAVAALLAGEYDDKAAAAQWGPVEHWNTSNVTDMSNLFADATSFNNYGIPLKWDTRAVTNMSSMFKNANAFDNGGMPLEFDTRRVTDMSYMFNNATSFNQPLGFDTRSVTYMSDMFNNATSFNQSLQLDTRNVIDMRNMFKDATSFNNGGTPLVFDTRIVTDMSYMFNNATSFNQRLPWDVKGVKYDTMMFRNSEGSLLRSNELIAKTISTSDTWRKEWDSIYDMYGGSPYSYPS